MDWLKALSGVAGAARGYGNVKMGRPPGAGAPAAGGSGILGALGARRKQQQESFGKPTRPYSTPPGAPQGQPPSPSIGEGPIPQAGGPPPDMPDLMRPVPGGSPMQGPAPPAMSSPGMPGPGAGIGGPPPGGVPPILPPGGGPPPPGAGPTPPTNPYPGLGDDDDNENPDQRMASGGVVNKPTTALLGEDGPEMVVPLNRRPGNKVSLANLPGQRPGGLPGAPPPHPAMGPAMHYRSRFR
jgi:hypothetical protein